MASAEARHSACGLGPERVSAGGLLKLTRGHRRVGNGSHSVKDRWWGGDRHRTRQERVGEGATALRNAALSILRVAAGFEEDEPVRARADRLGRKIDRAIDLVTRPFS